jgi:molybdopterin-containing oxidoreductase family membrane subunit
MNAYYKPAGVVAFVWRLILTTGTGSIFGFLVARSAYDTAVLAPLFIAMSLSFGLAIYLLVLLVAYHGTGRALGDGTVRRLKNLLGVFIATVLLFVLIYHLTKLYSTQHHAVERFLLLDGGIYTFLFWAVQIGLGSLVPLVLLFHPAAGHSRAAIALSAVLVVVGGVAAMYVIIIGGQAYPLEMFPGWEIQSSFFDSGVNAYTPSIYEIALGVGGTALALAMVMVAIKVLRFLPLSLADAEVETTPPVAG